MSVLVDVASWICLLVGTGFCIVGGIGMLRMPDLYTRSHAASLTDTLGATLVLVGLGLQSGLSLVTVKLAFVLIFLYVTSPTAAHVLLQAARARGVHAELLRSEEEAADGRAD